MKADHLSFKRAASVSMLGFAIQLAITLILLLYGIYGGDNAAKSAAFFSLVGVFVWLVLVLLYDQHRRERLEAMEAEALAGEAGTSVFEEGAADLRLASKRLHTWYKLVIPIASILIGAALIGLGYWRFRADQALARPGALPATEYRGWAIAFGLIIAFVGFVFARFVSGMAKQPIWANLRGGAAYAVGAAIIGLLIAVAQFVDVAGSDAVRRLLLLGIPAAMIALGVEVFLNFLLDLYRPRKKGEFPRPAFDSRVLAFASAPDRIARSIGEALDYQFGFGVQETWFYRLILRSWPVLIVAGILVVWGLSALAVVSPDERGMILRFGRVIRDDVGPGLHLKAPWPIDRVVVPELVERTAGGDVRVVGHTATGVRTLHLGTPPPDGDGPVLWTNEHTREEVFHICQPSQGRGGEEGAQGRDLALVAIEVPLSYAVADARLYDQLGPPGAREEILRVAGQRALTQYISAVSIDRVLGGNRSELAEEIRQRVQETFDGLNPDPETGRARGAGVEILSVTVAHMHPPREVAPKYEEVVIAQQNREATIETARAAEVEALAGVAGSVEAARRIVAELDRFNEMGRGGAPEADLAAQEAAVVALMAEAQGRAAEVLAQARAARWRKHIGAWSESVRYAGMVSSFTAAPLVYRAGQYFDVLRESLAHARIYIVSGDIPDLHVRTELQDEKVGIGLFQQNPEE
ncbi:MAG TPA: SPFH domain-containing protein [Phycisphaerales bacterium]|nr:SPFH domain-containing protein [Phycisphaerales bacterium]